MNELKVGVIGTGRIGKLHIENISRMPGVEVVAVSDIRIDEPLKEWAASLGIGSVTDNYSGMLADPDIAAVFICSPTDTHPDAIVNAARAGKHVFCEKPISLDPEQTVRALQAADAANVRLQVGFNRRFDRNFSRIRSLVAEGRIGKPHLIKITSRDPFPPSSEYVEHSGGLFMDMAIHDFDMARYLAGSEVVEVYAAGAVLVDDMFREHGDIDTAVVTLTFASGALGIIDNSRQAVYGYDQRVEVFGSEGCLTASNEYPNNVQLWNAEGTASEKPLLFFLERYEAAYIEEVRQFVDCIRSGEPLAVSGADALAAERIAHAAKRSLQLGVPVRMEE